MAAADRDVSSFVGSFPDGHGQRLIVLEGDADAAVLDRLGAHLDDAVAARTRFLCIDASAVTRCAPGLLDLLGRTQRRLARNHGMLTVRGLTPHLVPEVAGTATPRRAGRHDTSHTGDRPPGRRC